MESLERQAHWDNRYRMIGAESVSWFEAEPALSLQLLDRVEATRGSSIIDIGGGASNLSQRLVERGFTDVTVLDLSKEALNKARHRLRDPEAVSWIQTDLLAWRPSRRWGVWHDRAVFHFLTDPSDRETYRLALRQAVVPGGAVIIATFAEDGPTSCSGLPVERYGTDRLLAEIGIPLFPIEVGRVEHVTPAGVVQPFSWIAGRVAGA